jgi:hemoglobin/transferrin/lactoferrin receptor protein
VKAQDPEGEDIIDPGFGGGLMTRYPNGGSSMSSFGAFTSAKRSIGDRIFHIGLRYSYASFDAEFIPTSAIELPFSDVHSANGALTGSLAAELPISETLSSVSSLSSGFRHPNIDDAVKVREKGGYVLVPNDSLNAEYLYSLDESITWRHPSSDLSFSVAGFISLWTDIITPVNLNGDSTLVVDGAA